MENHHGGGGSGSFLFVGAGAGAGHPTIQYSQYLGSKLTPLKSMIPEISPYKIL